MKVEIDRSALFSQVARFPGVVRLPGPDVDVRALLAFNLQGNQDEDRIPFITPADDRYSHLMLHGIQ